MPTGRFAVLLFYLAAVLLLAGYVGMANTMSTEREMKSAQELRKIAGAVAGRTLSDEVAETLPVPQKTKEGVVILILYYRETGRPNHRTVNLPDHAMQIDPYTGQVLRFWACHSEDVGIEPPLKPVPGAGISPKMTPADFFRKRERFLDISSTVWKSYAAGTTNVDAHTAGTVREYWHLFRDITKAEVAPFYVAATPDYFQWVRQIAGA